MQLLHHQIRLNPQQQRLAGVGTAGGGSSLQHLRLNQGLFANLRMTRLKAALRPGLKSGERRGPHGRPPKNENQQDCDGARGQGSGDRFTEMMP